MSIAKRPNVAKHLTNAEYRILADTHEKHIACMGLEQRNAYTMSHIVKVERNTEENCLNVHYENGDWWHYTPNGTWY